MTIRTIAHKRLVVGEKKQRFGFRKTILGLCGAILGSTLLMADAANNAHTVHAAEFNQDQAKSVQTKADAAKDNGASTDVSKASAKTPVEAKGNEGTNTANGLNGKAGQPLAKKEVPQLNSSLKQNEKAGADKNQGADKGKSVATAVSSASDTKSAAQSAATAASRARNRRSVVQSAATAASRASDTNSFVQLMADNATAAYNSTPIDDATSQTNSDGKTQYSSLDNAQNLSFESNAQDSSAPTATGVNLTGTYTQANLPQQFKNDGMTGDTFWLYSGADLLNGNVSITKNWANAGSINGQNVDFHETFHDFVAQNNPGTHGISSIKGVDKKNPYLILISSNAVDNIDVYNANFQETFWFTHSDDGSIVDITKFDQAHAAQNNNQIFYFLSASLSSNNGVNSNRREYVQTNDAKTVVISKNPINDPSTGFTAPASTIGLTRVYGSNVPGGLVYTNTDPSGYQSHDGEDSNPDYYALQGGVTFANFTSNKPTLYLGAVPINASSAPWWWHGNQPWWHGNHNKNSDFLSFVTYSIFNNKKVNETINYVDQTGKTVAPSDTANPITFITVKAWNGTTTYYKFGSQEDPTLDNAGKPDSSWIQADNAKFGAIDNPTVKGYKVISNDAPNSDLTSVAQQNVTADSDDLHYTVVYAPAYSASDLKQISETIHYVNEQGVSVAPDNTKASVSFVTITNPVDGSTKNFYSRTETSTPKLDNDGKPIGDWQEGNSADFDLIANPTVNGYHVISTNDPDNNLSQITAKIVTKSSDNLVYKVIYAPNAEKANVTYIDDTTGKTLSTKDLTGNYGSTDPYRTNDTIAGYENAGYKLVSDNYPTSGVTYNEDGTVQSFQVHLTHSTTPVGPNNPQTPGTPINPDNPDGRKWPEGTDKSSVTQTVIRTVNYLDKQTGKVVAKQVTEQVTYNRTAIVDKVTGQIIGYSTTGGNTVDQTDGSKAWIAKDSDTNWAAVTSPDLSSEGYTAPDKAVVAQTTVNPGDENASVDVYYNHVVVPVNPSNPETPGEPINPDNPNGPKWPDGTDKNSLTKTVNQTIHYQYVGGQTAAPDKTDSTTFDHQVEIDKVTGEIVKDDGWTAENGKTSFDSKNSPVIPGYTASKPASDSVDGLTQDSKDNVQTIVYAKNPVAGGNVTAKYVDENGNPIADDVIASGNVGDPYSTTQKDVPGYTFKEVQGNPTGSFTDQDQTVTYVYTKNPATDNNGGTGLNQPGKPGNGTDTGNSSSNQPGNPSQPSNATNNGVINTSTNTGSKVNNGAVNSPELPQTGENNSQSQTMSFIGILLAMFGSSLGFLGIKKRRND